MKYKIYYCYAFVEPHHPPISIILSLFFNSFFFFLLISHLNVILPPIFLLPFTFHLPTTTYLNITFPQFLHLSLFWLFLFPSSYYKFTILYFILYIVFHTHKVISLSVSLSKKKKFHFFVDFLNIFFLHLYFKLMNFCIIWNFTLG